MIFRASPAKEELNIHVILSAAKDHRATLDHLKMILRCAQDDRIVTRRHNGRRDERQGCARYWLLTPDYFLYSASARRIVSAVTTFTSLRSTSHAWSRVARSGNAPAMVEPDPLILAQNAPSRTSDSRSTAKCGC